MTEKDQDALEQFIDAMEFLKKQQRPSVSQKEEYTEQDRLNSQLAIAVYEKKPIEEIREIIAKGVDLEQKDGYGKSLLMKCVLEGNNELARLLVEAGANVNATDDKGNTVLMYAKTAEQAEFLIKAGADVNAKNDVGVTALMLAKNAEQTKMLIEAGADVNATYDDGTTVLMMVETAEQAKLLIRAGADVNAKNDVGETALMNAVIHENADKLTKGLIEAGADVNATNVFGETVLMKAALRGDVKQAKLLIDAGVALDTKNDEGKTALDIAKEMGNTEFAQFLKKVEKTKTANSMKIVTTSAKLRKNPFLSEQGNDISFERKRPKDVQNVNVALFQKKSEKEIS